MHPVPEQTPGVLPGKSHQSPSRQHRPADPRRESTVLFKGFTASTAETGLLEVEEIAEINGSPELVRVSHSSASVTKSQTPNPPASPSSAASGLHQATDAIYLLVNSNARAVCTEAAPPSKADVETADHQRLASSSQASSALVSDLEHRSETETQQQSPSPSQSVVAEPHLRARPAVKLQVCVPVFACAHGLDLKHFSSGSNCRSLPTMCAPAATCCVVRSCSCW